MPMFLEAFDSIYDRTSAALVSDLTGTRRAPTLYWLDENSVVNHCNFFSLSYHFRTTLSDLETAH